MENKMTYTKLRDIAKKELDELIKKGTLSPTEVEAAKNTICLINEIDKLTMKDEWHDETSGCHGMYYPPYEYSYGGGTRHMYSYDDRGATRSMARGDDTTSDRRMYGSFSYDGRSGHSIEDRVIDKIEQMMDGAQSNYERERLNQFIRVIDSMKGE